MANNVDTLLSQAPREPAVGRNHGFLDGLDGEMGGSLTLKSFVVTIIGVLAGLVVVLIPKGQFEAQKTDCLNNCKNLAGMLEQPDVLAITCGAKRLQVQRLGSALSPPYRDPVSKKNPRTSVAPTATPVQHTGINTDAGTTAPSWRAREIVLSDCTLKRNDAAMQKLNAAPTACPTVVW